MPIPLLAAAAAGSGLLKGGLGIFQNAKGNKLLKKLQYPTEVIPPAIKQNKVQAEIDANVGTPSEQYNKSIKNIQRNQLLSLSKGREGRFGLGLVAALNDNSNEALGELDAQDAANRVANKRNLQTVNNNYGQWQDKVWQNNVKDKYDRDYNYAMSLKGVGGQNIASGADSFLSGAGYGLAALKNSSPIEAEPKITNTGTGNLQRTATPNVEVGSERPTPAYRPMTAGAGKYVRKRPTMNLSYYR